jgi:hypothetical protein
MPHGIEKADVEIGLLALAHNLCKKWYKRAIVPSIFRYYPPLDTNKII